MKKRGTQARVKQAVDGGIVVLRRWIVVAPVGQRGGAAIDLVQRTHQRGDVQVLRVEHERQPGVHFLKIFQQCPVGRQPAQCCLPRVHVGVDEPGDDDETSAVNHQRVVGINDRRNLGQRVTRDQDVALRQITLRVHRDDGGAFDQRAHHG